MAIPTQFDPNQALWQVRIRMGSQFKGKGKDLDEYRREITYDKDKKTRQAIGAIRQMVNTRRAAGCMPFFGAYITNDLGKGQLIEVCKRAEREMQEIDPELHCTPVFLKIDTPGLMGDKSLFEELLVSMRTQIFNIVLERVKIQIERGNLTEKSKKALLGMLDKLGPLNIVNDPTVKADIENMRARILANQLTELRDEILEAQEGLKSRAEALELTGPGMTPAPEPAAESETPAEPAAPAPVIPLTKPARDLDL